MSLTPQQREQFRLAILSAFPNYDDLRMAIGEGDWPGLTNVRLEQFVPRDPMRLVAFNLVQWAEEHGRVKNLLEVCLHDNPANELLNELAAPIHQLDETPTPDLAEQVAIDTATYTVPTRPLTDTQRILIRVNIGLLGLLLLIVISWSCIFIPYATGFWGLTVLGGLVYVGLEMLKDRPFAERMFSVFRGVLSSWTVLGTGIAGCLAMAVLSFSLSQIKYAARTDEPLIVVAGEELSPGDWMWVRIPPGGRTLTTEKVGEGYDRKTFPVKPWWPTTVRVAVTPYVIIEPEKSLLDIISTTDTAPNRQWKLTVTRNGESFYRNDQYRGNPVLFAVKGNHKPSLGSFIPKRTPLLAPPDLAIAPGDKLHVELWRSTPKYVVDIDVGAPTDVKSALQVEIISKSKTTPP